MNLKIGTSVATYAQVADTPPIELDNTPWMSGLLTSSETESLVSICIPTFNGERWIQTSLASALNQTYKNVEVVVVDDASSDGTADIVRSVKDPRIRLIVNEQHRGLAANWNRCVQLARGSFIKFVFQDDVLGSECVAKMMPLFHCERVGVVFCRRGFIMELPEGPERDAYAEHETCKNRWYATLKDINDGRTVFLQWARADFRINWIGEPSSVMIRRSCLTQAGLFNENIVLSGDVDLWKRLALTFDIGFVDEELSRFRVHHHSTSLLNYKSNTPRWDYFRSMVELSKNHEARSMCDFRFMILREWLRAAVQPLIPRSIRRKIARSLRLKMLVPDRPNLYYRCLRAIKILT